MLFRSCSAFFTVQLSHPYMTAGKTIALTRQTFVGKVMSLFLNMLSRFLITFLPRNKHLFISWLQSKSTVILEPKKIKFVLVSFFFLPSIFHRVMGPGLPRWLRGKESVCHAGATGGTGLIPGSGRSPGKGHVYSLQHSCLENPKDREAWWAPQSIGLKRVRHD